MQWKLKKLSLHFFTYRSCVNFCEFNVKCKQIVKKIEYWEFGGWHEINRKVGSD